MSIFKRLKFVLKHNIDSDFIVVPFGQDTLTVMKFLRYEDAVAFANEEAINKPQFPKPGILVRIES